MLTEHFGQQGQAVLTLYTNSLLPVCVTNKEMMIQWANQSALERFPFLSRRDGIFSTLPPASLAYVRQELEKSKAIHAGAELQPFPVAEIHFSPLMQGKELLGALVIFQADEPSAYPNQSKNTQIISALNRQLRDPLSIIFSALSSLEQKKPEEKFLPYMDSISQNSYKILRTNLLLTEYMKYLGGCNPLAMQLVDAHQFLHSLAQKLQNALPSDAVLHLNYPPSSCTLALDSSKMILALTSLVSNSYCFRRADVPPEMELSLRFTQNSAIFSVKDNGSGISQEVMPNIFFPYYSYGGTGQPFAGLGLGLTIVKLIAVQHGGSVVAFSDTQEGAQVAMTIPLQQAPRLDYWVEDRGTDLSSDRFSVVNIILCHSRLPPEG